MKGMLIIGCSYFESYIEQKGMNIFFNYSQFTNELYADTGFRIIRTL